MIVCTEHGSFDIEPLKPRLYTRIITKKATKKETSFIINLCETGANDVLTDRQFEWLDRILNEVGVNIRDHLKK